MAPLSLSECIRLIGDDKVTIQNIVDNMTNIRVKGRGKDLSTVITFVTAPHLINPTDVFHMTQHGTKPSHYGLAVWLPSDLYDRAQKGELEPPGGRPPAVEMPGGWRRLVSMAELPEGDVLVTNNLTARNSYGQMSHVWIGWPQIATEDGALEWICFTDGDRKIRNLSHWHPLPSPNVVSEGLVIL